MRKGHIAQTERLRSPGRRLSCRWGCRHAALQRMHELASLIKHALVGHFAVVGGSEVYVPYAALMRLAQCAISTQAEQPGQMWSHRLPAALLLEARGSARGQPARIKPLTGGHQHRCVVRGGEDHRGEPQLPAGGRR